MHMRSQQLGTRGVSVDMKASWAAPEHDSTLAYLENMARFQQKQLQEKEQKLLQLYDQQQQRAYQVVQRGSAGSNHGAAVKGATATSAAMTTTMTTTTHTTSTSQGGKVRQMFDERRQTTVKGIDRSYPLEPLENKLRKQTTGTSGLAAQRNGNTVMNRQSVIVKRAARADVNSNVNGGKPVVSYHEEVTRESFGPSVHRHGDEDEFGVATFANGYHRHDIDNQREDALDQETIERNRMMAKVHLMGYDETLKHRVRNDLESEEFPEYLIVDVPDKLPKRSVTKKLSQAEARLERFKNANAKRSNMPKHYSTTSNASVTKKRSEQMVPARSNSRGSEIAGTSPTGARSGSSWTSERSQRNPERVKNPPPADNVRAVDRAYAVEKMSTARRASSDIETFSRRDNPSRKAETASRIYYRSSDFKSLTPDGKIFVRRSTSPQLFRGEFIHPGTITSNDRKSAGSRSASADRYMLTKRSTSPELFYREGERVAKTMSIDRKSTGSRSTSSDRYTSIERSARPEFFRKEDEQSAITMNIDRRTDEMFQSSKLSGDMQKKRSASTRYSDTEFNRSATTTNVNRKDGRTKSLEWDRKTSSRDNANPQYLYRESERSSKAATIDRSATGFESSDTREKLFTKPRVTSQHLQKLFGKSDANVRVDRKYSSSRSPLFYREKRGTSPAFFLSESEQSRKTSESTSPAWSREISPRRSASPRYFSGEFERSETTSTDRKSTGSKLSEWRKEILAERNTIPRYFDKKSRRASASLDRETPSKSPSYEREISEKRSASLGRGESERSATPSTSTDRKYIGSKSSETTRDRRPWSPQFFCRESEKSATTMLIEPRSGSTEPTENTSKQRSYVSYVRPKRSTRSSPLINRNVRSTHADGHTTGPSVVKRETKKDSKEDSKIYSAATETRRSSRISETSATSASSIVSLKYGLEFDNIFQSAGLVRKFMKSHDGEQPSNKVRLSSTKRGTKKTVSVQTTKNNQPKNRYGTCSLLQKTRSPSIGRRTTPESPRKSITPTEVDVEIQEITMTDHRIERDKLRKAPSPAPRDRVERTCTKSPDDRTKLKTSLAYPAGKIYRRKTPVLESDVFASRPGSSRWKNKGSEDRQSAARGRSVRAALKYENSSPSMDDESTDRRKRHEDKEKDTGVDEVDVGIDTKYRTVVEGTLNRRVENDREIARPSSVLDRIERKSNSPRGNTRTPDAARKTISATKDCGRRHDIDSDSSSRLSSLRRASRGAGVPRIPSRTAASRTPARNSKFLTYSVHEERKRGSVAPFGREESPESYADKASAESTVERLADDAAREFSIMSTRRGSDSERDLARMDSVESALRRFDSVGAVSERSGPPRFRTSPEISLRTMDVRTRISAEDLIASRGSTVDTAREITTWKSTARTPAGRSVKLKNGARKSDSRRVPKEKISERTKKGGNSAENRRESAQRRLPTCKRRLFESDAGKGIQAARAKSSYAKMRKEENYSASVDLASRRNGTTSKARSALAKRSERAGTPVTTISVKPLRSIEDIRRSIERGKLIGARESKSTVIANRRTAFKSRKLAGADGERADVARNAPLLAGEPASSTKIKYCVSRITKSPSPDATARRQHETNARAARASAPASPSKSPDIAPRRASTEAKNQEAKPTRRPTAAKGAESMEVSKTTGTVDVTDGVALRNGSLRESSSTSKSDASVVDFDDRPSKESDTTPARKMTSMRSTSDKHQTASSVSSRPISVSSNSSVSATHSQTVNTKNKMATKVKTPNSSGPQAKGSFLNKNAGNAIAMDNLTECKSCGRRFATDRIGLHEEICAKTMNKKRKQFNAAMFRVRGTELEPFTKKNVNKKQESNPKKQLKSDWRRKHDDFIATIRYAKQAQIHIAAGGKLSDLPQPPASDTSDYIQCPHCGRKFNQAAAERHIPKCERMLHNKPSHARAPRR